MKVVDRYALKEAYYKGEDIDLSGKDLATFICEIHEELEELREEIKKIKDKQD